MKFSGMKIKNSRKSQFYIFAAVILISFIVVSAVNFRRMHSLKESEIAESLCANYETEAYKTINYAVLNRQNTEIIFGRFMDDFERYSLEKSFEFRQISIIFIDDETIIFNRAKEPVSLLTSAGTEYNVAENSTLKIPGRKNLTAFVSETAYEISLNPDESMPEFRAIIFLEGSSYKIVKLI